jgi:sugar phosphate permease
MPTPAAPDPAAPTPAPGDARFRYGWIVLVVAAFVVVLGAGTRAAPGALLTSIRDDTGWSTAEIALAGAAGLLLLGLAGPASALLIDRFGVRRVAVVSMLVTAAGMGGSALARELWQLVILFGLLSGFGAGLVTSSLGPVVANRWFVRGRGTILGLFGASSSAGQLVFFPVLTAIAVGAGWREAAAVMAGLLVVAAIPAALFLVERPSDVGERPRGATEDTPPVPLRSEPGIMRRAVRRPEFWLLAGTFFVCGATSNGVVGQHFIAHAVDNGFGPVVASGALALMGAFNFVGTLASGWLTDRVDPRRLLLVYYVFRGISLLFLPAVADTFGIVGFAVLFGLDYIATVPPTVALCADTFGRRNVGIIYGWVYFSHMLGAAILAEVAGVIRDTSGTYSTAFVIAGWMAMAAGVAALIIRRPKPQAPVAVPA